jgi:hypothetical protein
MKHASNFLKILMAAAMALLPLQADAKPKKEGGGKKREKSSEVKRDRPKEKQREVRRAPQKQKQRVAKVSRPDKPKRDKVARNSPKENRVKSPAKTKQQRVVKRDKAPKEKAAVAKRDKDLPKKVKREDRPDATARADGSRKKDSPRGDRNRPGKREDQTGIVSTDTDRPDQALAGTDKPGRDREGSRDRDRDGNRGRDRDGSGDRDRDGTRDRDRNRDGDRRNLADRQRGDRAETEQDRQRRVDRDKIRDRVGKDRKQQLANRNDRNRDRVERFRKDRQRRLAAVQRQRQSLRATRAEARREYVREAREEIRDYWKDRADDVRDRLDDRYDDLFDDDWWEDRHWHHRPVYVSSPWWWWRPAPWSGVNVFLNAGWSEPIAYDYGTDVIYDDASVYVHGVAVGTPVEYSRQVVQLANPTVTTVAEAPVIEDQWTPMGVFALVQEDQGDAVMFFQLSVNRSGIISGAYTNVMSGEAQPVTGQIDRTTQRAAWHIGDQKEKVFEAGVSNLAQDQASCLVHLAPGEMQNWLLVRMESPELPDSPTRISDTTPATPELVTR